MAIDATNGIIRRAVDGLRRPDWLTRERAIAWSAVLLAEQVLVFAFLGLWQAGYFVAIAIPPSSDFVSFYAAGQLTLAGTPWLAYDQPAHHLAEQAATVVGASYQFFFYPPVFLFLCAGLATLPYLVAFVLYQVVTLFLFLIAMRGVLGERGWNWSVPVLAFPAIFWTIGVGQNAFLVGALFGGFALLIERRPVAAGVLLGMLICKPHLALLVPFALAAGGRWRVVSAAALTVAGLVGLSILMFGWHTWQDFLTAFAGSTAVYRSGRIDFAGMVSVFGAVRLIGGAPGTAYAIQAVSTVAMAALVIALWWRCNNLPVRMATLLAATLLAVPLILLYDEVLALLAIGWLVRDAKQSGFLPWDKTLLLAVYLMALVTWTTATAWHVPLGPMISIVILSLCLRRACARVAGL